jgi:hypothetical protein
VIRHSDSDTRKYVGEIEILKGLAALRPTAKKAGK